MVAVKHSLGYDRYSCVECTLKDLRTVSDSAGEVLYLRKVELQQYFSLLLFFRSIVSCLNFEASRSVFISYCCFGWSLKPYSSL